MPAGRPTKYADRTAEIYTLADPLSGEVRYIGKANNSAARLKSHLRDAHVRKTPVYAWIRKLAESGLVPIISIIEKCPHHEWELRERAAIEVARSVSIRLLNVADGGALPACGLETRVKNARNVALSRPKAVMVAYRILEANIREARKNGWGSLKKLEDGLVKFNASVHRHRVNGTLGVLDEKLAERFRILGRMPELA